MARTIRIEADPSSSLTKFFSMLLRHAELVDWAIQRDAYALNMADANGMTESAKAALTDRRRWAKQAGQRERRVWTQRDSKYFAFQHGLDAGGFSEPARRACRIADWCSRVDSLNLYRAARADVIAQQTAAVDLPAIEAAWAAHDGLIAAARRGKLGDAWVELHQQAAAIFDRLPPPPPKPKDGPDAMGKWRHNGVVIDRTLKPTPWRALQALWNAPGHCMTFTELSQSVEDDHEAIAAEDDTYGSWRREINKFFDGVVPWKATIKKRTLKLVPIE